MDTTVTWLSPCTYKAELSGRRQFVECTIAASSIASLISGRSSPHRSQELLTIIMWLPLLTLTCAILATCSPAALFDKREMFVHFYDEEASVPVQDRNADYDELTKRQSQSCTRESVVCSHLDYYVSGYPSCCDGLYCGCGPPDPNYNNCKCVPR
ncbi:hypothetical protein BsWGS_13275 [Bradybaena similaris]